MTRAVGTAILGKMDRLKKKTSSKRKALSYTNKKWPRLVLRVVIFVLLTVTPVLSWVIWRGETGGRSVSLDTLPQEDKERLGELVLRVSSNPDDFEIVYGDFWGILQKKGDLSPSGAVRLKETMRELFYLPKLFWEDARESVRRKRAIKSAERERLEKRFLRGGFLSERRIALDQETMEELADENPVEAEHGVEILVDEAMVNAMLDTWNEDQVEQIIDTLFRPPP